MFAVALTGLGEDKYLTDAQGEIKQFEDGSAAELVLSLFSEYYGAQVVRVNTVTVQDLRQDAPGAFVAKRNEATDNWNVWDKAKGKWAGADLNTREQARSLARILNSQTLVGV